LDTTTRDWVTFFRISLLRFVSLTDKGKLFDTKNTGIKEAS